MLTGVECTGAGSSVFTNVFVVIEPSASTVMVEVQEVDFLGGCLHLPL